LGEAPPALGVGEVFREARPELRVARADAEPRLEGALDTAVVVGLPWRRHQGERPLDRLLALIEGEELLEHIGALARLAFGADEGEERLEHLARIGRPL